MQRREAEIEDLHPAVQREEDVLRLQVAMHDAAFVRGAKPSGHLEGDVERRVHRKCAGAETRAQRLAFQTLRHEVRGTAVIPDVVDGQHVGVIERAGGARLVLKRAHSFGGVRRMRKQQLDRHVAPESLVARPPHLAHPARSQPPLDRVGGDPIAGLNAPPLAGDLPREDVERRRGEKVARLLHGGQQRRDLVPQAGIGATRAGEEIRTHAGGLLHRFREELVRDDASGQWAWTAVSVRYSHARANAQSV